MKRLFVYSLTVFILGLGVVLRIAWYTPETKLPKKQEITFLATVKNEPKISGTNQIIEVGDSRVYVDLFPRWRVGDRLMIEGEVDEHGNIFRPQVEKVSQAQVRDLNVAMASVRAEISGRIAQILPSREATLLSGTVLGVDNIERDFRDQLIKTGTIHVVVVSGQNLMIVSGIFMSMVRYLGRRQSLVLAVIAVFAYAAFTGFEPPVVRASLMVLASTLAVFLGRQSYVILNIFVAALLIIFIWPEAILEISFQLTFAATLGIATLGQKLASFAALPSSKSARRGLNTGSFHEQSASLRPASRTETFLIPKKISKRDSVMFLIAGKAARLVSSLFLQNAAIATSAYIFTAPIILFYFGQVSPLAPIANILVAEAIFPIMILGFLVAISSMIFLPFAQFLAYLAWVPAFYFVRVVEIFADIPVEQVRLGKGSILTVIGCYMFLVILMWIWTRKSKVVSQSDKR